jgi:multiple sugar transport system substrate-binding protein
MGRRAIESLLGFAQEEDVSFKKIVADYEKTRGNTIDYNIVPYAPMRQKIVSAMTSGVVPDLFQNTPAEIIALYAWQDKLVDVSDVVETQREEYTETALLTAHCHNNVEKKRSYYGVPYTVGASMNHIWRPLIEKAGYQMEDMPKTWDAFYDFFKDVQKKLRAKGMRNVYGLGFQMNTAGNDSNARANDFLIAYGCQDIVTKDGKLHLDDPKVRKAAIEMLTYPTTAYKEGYVPPGAINWNDADDNNAFHAQQSGARHSAHTSTSFSAIGQSPWAGHTRLSDRFVERPRRVSAQSARGGAAEPQSRSRDNRL